MGIYATTTTLALLLPNFLRDNTTTTDREGTSIFGLHIDRAESLVNARVAQRYGLPFAVVPPLIRTVTQDIATWMAIRGTLNQDGKVKNVYLDSYEKAMEILEEIVDGSITLVDTNGSVLDSIAEDRFVSSTENRSPIFGLDDAVNWQRDADEIEETQASRDEQS